MIFEVNSPRNYTPGPVERDPAYLKFIRAIGWCIACGRNCFGGRGYPGGRAEAIHTGLRGLGQKASDYNALPGCRECHSELHEIGEVAFQEKWGLCFRDHIKTLNERYRRMQARRAA